VKLENGGPVGLGHSPHPPFGHVAPFNPPVA
jgi:hypothetical protein